MNKAVYLYIFLSLIIHLHVVQCFQHKPITVIYSILCFEIHLMELFVVILF